MKIGFQVYAGSNWLAGQSAAASILSALRALGPGAPKLAMIVWPGMGPQDHTQLSPFIDQTIRLTPPPRTPLVASPLRRRVVSWLRGSRPQDGHDGTWQPAADVLQQQGVDVVFTTPIDNRPAFGRPTVLWLPDFQHLHLPSLFSKEERTRRDRLYQQELDTATLVLVTAEAVRQDFASFAPSQVHKARVLPFVISPPPALYSQDPAALAQTYHLPERFLWMPNHFWKHKNHMLVLEALCLLRSRSIFPCVVCAGNLSDYRNPDHVAALLRRVSELNLRQQFIVLGMLPNAEVVGLMRQAVCVLNPSLFEGFGLSVAESKFIGKRALLSDIPAHREQNPPGALYFDPNNAVDLADKLEMVWQSAKSGPDLIMEAEARAAFPQQQTAFGRAILRLAEEAARLQAQPA